MAKDKTPKTIFIFDIFAVLIALIPVVNSVVYMHTDKRMDYHLLLLLVLISFIVIAFTSASLLYTYPKFFYQALIFPIVSSISFILSFVFDFISGYHYPIAFLIYPCVSLVSWLAVLIFKNIENRGLLLRFLQVLHF